MLQRTTTTLTASAARSIRRIRINPPSPLRPATQSHHHLGPRLTRSIRPFHLSAARPKGLQPDSQDPTPPQPEALQGALDGGEPANITEDEYHEIADEYIEELVLTLEEKAEKGENGLEVEYSAGVLTLSSPVGTYVLNKQPPNKQIWISSPRSGPKRYDWVRLKGEGQDQKEGTDLNVEGDLRGGQWVYLRDGSRLTDLLKKELDVRMNPSEDDVGA